jgi:hypothetical protein
MKPSDATAQSMTRRPNGPYLIESTPQPQYLLYLTANAAREACPAISFFWPLSILSAAISGYRSELRRMLDAPAIYLGPGK